MGSNQRTINITVSANRVDRNPRTARTIEDRAYIGKVKARAERNPRCVPTLMDRTSSFIKLQSRTLIDESWMSSSKRGLQTKGTSVGCSEVDKLLAQRYGQVRLVPSRILSLRNPHDLRYTTSNQSNARRLFHNSAKDPRFRRTIRVVDKNEEKEEVCPVQMALNFDDGDSPAKSDSDETRGTELVMQATERGDESESSGVSVAVQTHHWPPRGRAASSMSGRRIMLKRSSSDNCLRKQNRYEGFRYRSEGRKSNSIQLEERRRTLKQYTNTETSHQALPKVPLETEGTIKANEPTKFDEVNTQNMKVQEQRRACKQYTNTESSDQALPKVPLKTEGTIKANESTKLEVSTQNKKVQEQRRAVKQYTNTESSDQAEETIKANEPTKLNVSTQNKKVQVTSNWTHDETQETDTPRSSPSLGKPHHSKDEPKIEKLEKIENITKTSTSITPVSSKLAPRISYMGYANRKLLVMLRTLLIMLIVMSVGWTWYIGIDLFRNWLNPPRDGWAKTCSWIIVRALRKVSLLEECECT